MSKLSELLHNYCTQHHMTDEDFYQLLNLKTTTQSNWRFGALPEPDLLLCFWEVTGISVEQLEAALQYDVYTQMYQILGERLRQL